MKRGLGREAGAGEEGSAPGGGLGGSEADTKSPRLNERGHKDRGRKGAGRRMRATWRCRMTSRAVVGTGTHFS